MNHKRGIVGTIILLIVALILLGYFQIDVKSVVTTPAVQNNLLYAWNLVISGLVNLFHFVVSVVSNSFHH